MNITCNVIKDILPLYAENMVCEDTRKIVDEHISTCLECKNDLELMNQPQKIMVDIDKTPFKRARKKIFIKKVQAVVLAILLVLSLSIAIFAYLTSRQYYPYKNDIITYNIQDNGGILVTFREDVTGSSVNQYITEDGYECIDITSWNTLLDKYNKSQNAKSVLLEPKSNKINAIYYYTSGENNTLIYSNDYYGKDTVVTLPRLVLNYYFIIAIVIATIGGIILFIIRKQMKSIKIIVRLELLPISYIIGHICIESVSGTVYNAGRDFCLIILVSICIYSILNLAYTLLEKKSKFIE